ncbi:hypothetical protein PIB30_072195 [Stylosanthes scabra]|uniref:Uncharacterized protein n=1 Tax=Stylosanthes scabra TaxID=79078 RepID=A0ABU6YM75_9FABA|nr:hypothetical protein [Stylosanthes scabra]
MPFGSARLVHMPRTMGHMHGKVVHTYGWVVDLGHIHDVLVHIGYATVVVRMCGMVVEVDSTTKERNLFLVGFGIDFGIGSWVGTSSEMTFDRMSFEMTFDHLVGVSCGDEHLPAMLYQPNEATGQTSFCTIPCNDHDLQMN